MLLYLCISCARSSYEGEEMASPNVPSAPNLISRLSPRFRKGKRIDAGPVVADPLGVGVSLAHLIECKQWSTVLARIKQEPLEAEQDLQVMTRGGFMSGERKPPVDVVKKLIEANNVAILTRSMPGGCLPIHIACTWGASPEVIKVLLAADPTSARVKDELGNIPLHSACFSGASIQVIEALLKADSKSLLTRNHQGSRPLDISKRLRHDNRATVMDLLLNRKEELMKTHGRSRSSGLLSDMAREAEEMNQRYAFVKNVMQELFLTTFAEKELRRMLGVLRLVFVLVIIYKIRWAWKSRMVKQNS
jgi:Ankyrin repeats (3 copies)